MNFQSEFVEMLVSRKASGVSLFTLSFSKQFCEQLERILFKNVSEFNEDFN